MVREITKEIIRTIVPLTLRKYAAIAINRQKRFGHSTRYWWTYELLRDFAKDNRNQYHRFLWSNHLAYALTYELDAKYGSNNLPGSRRLFFNDMREHLDNQGISRSIVESVFDVGCSLGYQLRYLEENFFRSASTFEGLDIDRYAISKGNEYLETINSKIKLVSGDMKKLEQFLGNRFFDIMTCTGVLMYLDEKEAASVVEDMAKHCRMMMALSGPAHPDVDNRNLTQSDIRKRDGSFIHNMDAMVERAGWKVYARRWEGRRKIDGHSIYFIFAVKN